jgi:UPF0716 protein FxsA
MSAFVYIGREFGVLLTLIGIVLTGVFGIALLKQQGVLVFNRIQTEIREGQTPVKSISDSISLLFGAVLMLIPGYVTDVIGLIMFIPGIRTIAGIYILKWFTQRQRFTSWVHFGSRFDNTENVRQRTTHDDDIIEGEFEERSDHSKHLPKS